MKSGEPPHPFKAQSEVLGFLSAWQTERVRTGQAANQLLKLLKIKGFPQLSSSRIGVNQDRQGACCLENWVI